MDTLQIMYKILYRLEHKKKRVSPSGAHQSRSDFELQTRMSRPAQILRGAAHLDLFSFHIPAALQKACLHRDSGGAGSGYAPLHR